MKAQSTLSGSFIISIVLLISLVISLGANFIQYASPQTRLTTQYFPTTEISTIPSTQYFPTTQTNTIMLETLSTLTTTKTLFSNTTINNMAYSTFTIQNLYTITSYQYFTQVYYQTIYYTYSTTSISRTIVNQTVYPLPSNLTIQLIGNGDYKILINNIMINEGHTSTPTYSIQLHNIFPNDILHVEIGTCAPCGGGIVSIKLYSDGILVQQATTSNGYAIINYIL